MQQTPPSRLLHAACDRGALVTGLRSVTSKPGHGWSAVRTIVLTTLLLLIVTTIALGFLARTRRFHAGWEPSWDSIYYVDFDVGSRSLLNSYFCLHIWGDATTTWFPKTLGPKKLWWLASYERGDLTRRVRPGTKGGLYPRGYGVSVVMSTWVVVGGLSAYPLWWAVTCPWRARRRRRRGLCEGCGYDLTGNVSGVCPECARPTRRQARNKI